MKRIKRIIRFIIALIIVFPTTPAMSEWEFLGPEGAGSAGRFTLSSAAPDTIYLVGSGSLFKTMDAGENWQRLPNAPQYIHHALFASPSHPNVVYAANNVNPPNKPVARTDNGGNTWENLTQPVQEDHLVFLSDLAVHPQNSLIVYGVWNYVYRSFDGGRTWQELKNGLKSSVRPTELVGLQRIAIDPKRPEIIYTVGGLGVFKSEDGGDTWREITQGITIPADRGLLVHSITIDPNVTERVYLCIDWDILGSSDGGEHWRNLTAGKFAQNPRFVKVAISPANSAHLYAASPSGIFRSIDAGDTWQQVWKGQWVWDIAVHATNSNRVFASVNHFGFLRSDDGGQTWLPKNRGMDAITLEAVAVSLRNPMIIYMDGQEFYRSEDGGKTWQLMEWNLEQFEVGFSGFSIHPADDRVIYRIIFYVFDSVERGLAKSEDGGKTWTILRGVHAPILHLAIDPIRPKILYASTYPIGDPALGRLLRSLDAGITWEEITPSFFPPLHRPEGVRRIGNLVFHPMDSNILFLANEIGVARGDDQGETWENISRGLAGNVDFIAIDPKDGNLLFAADQKRLYRSIDGGKEWKAVADIPARRLAISSAGTSIAVYAAGNQQVWLSVDGGNNWKPINDNLPPIRHISALVTHPTEAGIVFITTDRGLFRYRLEGVVAVFPKSRQLTTWGEVKQTQLFQNYPNPFNPETWIPFFLAEDSKVTIRIYDIQGNLIRTLNLGHKERGLYLSKDKAAYWDGRNEAGEFVASGIYFVKLKTEGYQQVKRIVLLK